MAGGKQSGTVHGVQRHPHTASGDRRDRRGPLRSSALWYGNQCLARQPGPPGAFGRKNLLCKETPPGQAAQRGVARKSAFFSRGTSNTVTSQRYRTSVCPIEFFFFEEARHAAQAGTEVLIIGRGRQRGQERKTNAAEKAGTLSFVAWGSSRDRVRGPTPRDGCGRGETQTVQRREAWIGRTAK